MYGLADYQSSPMNAFVIGEMNLVLKSALSAQLD